MTGTRVVIAVVGALVLGVTACSGSDPEPRVAPPSSTSTSPTTSPSPSAPTMPAAARGTDAASAEAFVRFYWEMVNYAQATGDVSGLQGLQGAKCASCRAGVRYLNDVFASGGDIEGGKGAVDIKKVGFIKNGHSTFDTAVVDFVLITTPQKVTYPDSSKNESFAGGSQDMHAILSPTAEGWAMATWGTKQ